jgi:RHS repeat-associated protein
MTRYEYDALNRQTMTIDGMNGQTAVTYDSAGNVSSVTDPLGHQTQYKYDARNRVTDVIDPLGGDTHYGYDLNDNVTLVVDPDNNQTHYTYDGRKRLVKEIDPLGNATTYVYDGADNLVSQTDGDGRQIQFTYDTLNQLTTETWVGGSEVIHYGYDADGNLTSASDSSSGLTFTYNARNAVRTADNAGTPNAPHVVLTYGYDPVGNETSLADTINGQADGTNMYQVNALNEVTQITQSGTNVQPKRVNLTYNEVGQLASVQRYSDLAGNQPVVQSTYTYDALNRLTGLTQRGGSATVDFENLQYDAASRVTQITNADGTSNYTYDNTDQLKSVQNSNPATPNESYSYDANGNRTASSQPGSHAQTTAGNRQQTDGKFNSQYDNDGNLISRTEIATGKVRSFQWDYRNRLTAVIDKDAAGNLVQRVDYTYDVLDRRISESVQQGSATPVLTDFVYDSSSVLLDFGATGSNPPVLKERYLNGPAVDQVFAQEDGTGKVQWLLADHEGSVRDLVDNTGTVVNHISYDSFGNILKQTNPSVTTRDLFTGREFDAATGLYDYRSRYYDPAVGRFLGEDGLGFGGGDANLYRYVLNDPAGFVDPGGTEAFPIPNNYVCFDYVCKNVDPNYDYQKARVGRGDVAQFLNGKGYNRIFAGDKSTEGRPALQPGDVVLFRQSPSLAYSHATIVEQCGNATGLLIGNAAHKRGVYSYPLDYYLNLTQGENNGLTTEEYIYERLQGNNPSELAFGYYEVFRRGGTAQPARHPAQDLVDSLQPFYVFATGKEPLPPLKVK